MFPPTYDIYIYLYIIYKHIYIRIYILRIYIIFLGVCTLPGAERKISLEIRQRGCVVLAPGCDAVVVCVACGGLSLSSPLLAGLNS